MRLQLHDKYAKEKLEERQLAQLTGERKQELGCPRISSCALLRWEAAFLHTGDLTLSTSVDSALRDAGRLACRKHVSEQLR